MAKTTKTTPTATPPAAPGAVTTPAKAQPAVKAKTRVRAQVPAQPKATIPAPAAPKAVRSAAADAPAKAHPKPRDKLVRDSFTMPLQDFALIDVLKERALGFKRPTKKSELLRAGLQVLADLKPAELKQVLGRLVPLKTGRPKKAG